MEWIERWYRGVAVVWVDGVGICDDCCLQMWTVAEVTLSESPGQ